MPIDWRAATGAGRDRQRSVVLSCPRHRPLPGEMKLQGCSHRLMASAERYFSSHSAIEPSRPVVRIFTQRPLASYQTSRGRLALSR